MQLFFKIKEFFFAFSVLFQHFLSKSGNFIPKQRKKYLLFYFALYILSVIPHKI